MCAVTYGTVSVPPFYTTGDPEPKPFVLNHGAGKKQSWLQRPALYLCVRLPTLMSAGYAPFSRGTLKSK